MPESSARACVNVAKSNSIGLIWYCKEDDSFELDAEAVDEFYDNMDVLLSRNARENKRIKELEKELFDTPGNEIYVIGGESVYRQLLPLCDEV